MARIGFIGLGNMGNPMAQNMLTAGHRVTVFDLSRDAVAALASKGARPAASIAEAVADAETVITMLPAGAHMRAVYAGPKGVFASLAPGTLCIDCSTIDVATARDMSVAARAYGLRMVDAPVSGGVAAAQGGALTFMVGGAAADFDEAKPILAGMGKTIIHAGGAGNGQAAKICNNMLLAISMIGTCEAFVLADALGLDRQKLFDIASNASGQCWSLTSYCPVPGPVPTSPANREYRPGFTAAMMLKDLKLARDAAQTNGVVTPLGAEALALYAVFAAAGHDSLDFSAIFKLLKGSIATAA